MSRIAELMPLIHQACNTALKDVTKYDHSQVASWNSQIIVRDFASTSTVYNERLYNVRGR